MNAAEATIADIAENLQVWSDVINDKIEQHPDGLTLPPDFAQDLASALASHAQSLKELAAHG